MSKSKKHKIAKLSDEQYLNYIAELKNADFSSGEKHTATGEVSKEKGGKNIER